MRKGSPESDTLLLGFGMNQDHQHSVCGLVHFVRSVGQV